MTNVWNCMTSCQTGWLSGRLANPYVIVCVCMGGASFCAHARPLYMTSGACPPSLLLLAQKKEQPRRKPAPPAQIELLKQRGVLTSTPSPQWSPLSQPCTQPFSFSSSGGSQRSMEDSAQLFLLSPFKKEKSLLLLGRQS